MNQKKIDFQKIADIFRTPLTKDPLFFWLIFILSSINPVISYIDGDWIDLFLVTIFYYLVSYILLFITSSIWKLGRILKPIILCILFIYTVIALFCRIEFGRSLDNDIISILSQTNIREITEFVTSFFPLWTICLCLLLLSALLLLHLFAYYKFNIRLSNKATDIHLMAALYCAIVFMFCPERTLNIVAEAGVWNIPFDNVCVNLKMYEREDYQLEEMQEDRPDKIVVIIGESHAKSHSSLYGYSRQTNPLLEKLECDSSLFVFTNVTSPALYTVRAFKYILNTMQNGDDERLWYQYPTIISLMKSVGYHTLWFSNQDEVGLYDCTASSFAHLCDEYTFNNEPSRLDGSLIGLHKSTHEKELVVYNLMGQHVDFSKRYPAQFARFKPEDYADKAKHQRKVLSDYDNACLYNDYVISKIMNEYSKQDAVVIYLSDHGLDLFDSSDRYYGHAKKSNGKSLQCGTNIPFFIYVSDTFKNLHPKTHKMLFQSTADEFCTENLTSFILNIVGYKYHS